MHSRKRPVCDIRIPIRCAAAPGLWDCIALSRSSPAREFLANATRGRFYMMKTFLSLLCPKLLKTIAPLAQRQKVRGRERRSRTGP
jgi:hypothetical protein